MSAIYVFVTIVLTAYGQLVAQMASGSKWTDAFRFSRCLLVSP